LDFWNIAGYSLRGEGAIYQGLNNFHGVVGLDWAGSKVNGMSTCVQEEHHIELAVYPELDRKLGIVRACFQRRHYDVLDKLFDVGSLVGIHRSRGFLQGLGLSLRSFRFASGFRAFVLSVHQGE
jgi:hypothetical protein